MHCVALWCSQWSQLLPGIYVGFIRRMAVRLDLGTYAFTADMSDLVRQPTLDRNFMQPQQLKKRSGQPRMSWLNENCEYALKTHHDEVFDKHSADHINKIKVYSKTE